MSSNHDQWPGLPPLSNNSDNASPQGPYSRSQARPWPPTPSSFGWADDTAAPPAYVPNAQADRTPPSPALAGSRAWGTVTPGPARTPATPEPAEHGNLTREIPAISMDLDDGEVDNAFTEEADLLGACKIEFDRVGQELEELRMLIKQATREFEKLNHRKVLTASKVREMEQHLEHHSRADIRATYLAATEAEMRAFMIGEQREQMQAKFKVFSRYARFLRRAIEAIPQLAQDALAAQWDGWDASSPPDMYAPVGLPALPDTAGLGWQQQLGPVSPPPQTPDATEEKSVPAFAQAARHSSELAAVARVIQAQEDIRQRVAQRLHDGPTQSLANVMLTAEICEKLVASDPRHAQSELANLKGVVNAALQETRKFIFELRPMTLDDLGLVATLRRYASELAAKYQVQMPFTGPQGDRRLPKEIEVPVFRVAQEALANAVEHSRATVIHVTVALQPDALVLVVEDNGSGFDVEPVLARALQHETIGIASMQERAELLGGWLRIESTRGRGTRVELTVPVAASL